MKIYSYLSAPFSKSFKYVETVYISINFNILSIFLILLFNNLQAKDTNVIFKGKAVKFKKISPNEFQGRFNDKNIIASTKMDKNNKLYLGAFKRLKRKRKSDPQKKLVTYYVYEKS